MMPDAPLAWLLSLFAAIMLASGSASAMPLMAALCIGGTTELPGKLPRRDCALACHAGCTRRKGRA